MRHILRTLSLLIMLAVVSLQSCKEDDIGLFYYVTVYHQNPSYDRLRIEVNGEVVGYLIAPFTGGDLECGSLGPDRVSFIIEQSEIYAFDVFQGESTSPFIDGFYQLLDQNSECARIRIK